MVVQLFHIGKVALHLLNLSHMMVNSEIQGTSLSCPLCSWLLLRHLWKRRLAKDWSFPWAILRQISWCLKEKACMQSNRFQTRDQQVILASGMQPSALRCLANHIKLSFLFKYSTSVSVTNCLLTFSILCHLKALIGLLCKWWCFDKKGIQSKESALKSQPLNIMPKTLHSYGAIRVLIRKLFLTFTG